MDIVFLTALAVTSVISLTFIIERGLALRWEKVIPPDVVDAVQRYERADHLDELRRSCEYYPSAISRLIAFASYHLDWPKTEAINVLQTRARHEMTRLERGLVVLEIIVGIAPLLGLVGTIYGLILLFGSMGEAGTQDHTRFAQGISLALNATLFGLCIAIPTLVAWSYYSRKVETLAVEMESLCDEFLRKHYRSAEASSRAAGTSAAAQTPTPPDTASAESESKPSPDPAQGPAVVSARPNRRRTSR